MLFWSPGNCHFFTVHIWLSQSFLEAIGSLALLLLVFFGILRIVKAFVVFKQFQFVVSTWIFSFLYVKVKLRTLVFFLLFLGQYSHRLTSHRINHSNRNRIDNLRAFFFLWFFRLIWFLFKILVTVIWRFLFEEHFLFFKFVEFF
jgi:hypothetical protein